jgi:hypothetical protein
MKKILIFLMIGIIAIACDKSNVPQNSDSELRKKY